VWGSIFSPIDGEIAWPRLGHDVANAGDVNKDGVNDVVASAVQSSAGAGKVYVYSGADQSLLWSWSDSGSNGFGHSVAGAGDTDADGHADILVGMPSYSSNRGRVVVYSGKDGGVLDVLDGYAAGDRFGWCVDGLGDVNRNGFGDYLVSAYDAVPVSGQVGAVYVFDGLFGKRLRTYRGEARPGVNGDDYGFAAACAGDIDGDGLSGVIVGAPGWGGSGPPNASVNDGRAYTYLTPKRGRWLRYLPLGGVANVVRTAGVSAP
jgi:hypothetical protein